MLYLLRIPLTLLCASLLLTACGSEPPEDSYAARVGDAYLTEQELSDALQSVAVDGDTVEARRQIIEQWVTRTLLLDEAERLNLESEPDVQAQLEEQRRSVLINALTNRIYENAEMDPDRDDVARYFERHREQMRLREPYVQLRHLRLDDDETASEAAATLRETPDAWGAVCERDVRNAEQACRVGNLFFPIRQRMTEAPFLRERVAAMDAGDVDVTRSEDTYHVLHLVERIEAGQEPELEWVAPEIERRLRTQSRKQMYEREVQRLRNEAEARNALDVRSRPSDASVLNERSRPIEGSDESSPNE
ncbi:MAG: hypothetical protein PPP56_05270 [Longimonas sp.]|uniref:peptidyl-prolyl cis-trans isomerase n=1 Tax=Longimonas sp. TaxID=2039626 RepID=UPI003348BE7D